MFGPTSAENFDYATNNRNMWAKEGESIVKDMLARVESEYNKQGGLPAGEIVNDVDVFDA